MIVCSSCLGKMLFFYMSLRMLVTFLRLGLFWSGAAETTLADAYRFSGGPAPNRGLVLGRGRARFRVCQAGWAQGWGRLAVMLLKLMMLRRSVVALSLLPWGVCLAAQKTVCQNCGRIYDFHGFKLYMLWCIFGLLDAGDIL